MTDRFDAPLIGISCGFTDYGDYLGVAFSAPIERLGGVAVILPYTERPTALVERLDGLILAGGRDIEPERFGGGRHPRTTEHSPLRDVAEFLF
jgi:gamma-glutamyl-gamma-aminobutyrate hydrolase PuuD